jgi:CBS domain containing-hemolysin-like protein
MKPAILCNNALLKMLRMTKESKDPPSKIGTSQHPAKHNGWLDSGKAEAGPLGWFRGLIKNKCETTQLREAIDGYISPTEKHDTDIVTAQERALISNILNLRDISVVNVMVPRADIVAIEVETSTKDILGLLGKKQFSRIPVYRETLDDVLGTVHIKDILASLARGEKIEIEKLITEIPIVSPAMSILDLLLEMRESSRHIALVVDEYGGIDGLVTINDIIESIVGEIDDEHETYIEPEIAVQEDGSVIADSRVDLESFEARFGVIFNSDEHNENDTLGGLALYLAGHVPARGEIIKHKSGIVFEILDGDPRRVKKLRIRNLPKT